MVWMKIERILHRTHASIWVNIKEIISDKIPTKSQKMYDSIYMKYLWLESRMVVVRSCEEEKCKIQMIHV
jgi:hypothetical protein